MAMLFTLLCWPVDNSSGYSTSSCLSSACQAYLYGSLTVNNHSAYYLMLSKGNNSLSLLLSLSPPIYLSLALPLLSLHLSHALSLSISLSYVCVCLIGKHILVECRSTVCSPGVKTNFFTTSQKTFSTVTNFPKNLFYILSCHLLII